MLQAGAVQRSRSSVRTGSSNALDPAHRHSTAEVRRDRRRDLRRTNARFLAGHRLWQGLTVSVIRTDSYRSRARNLNWRASAYSLNLRDPPRNISDRRAVRRRRQSRIRIVDIDGVDFLDAQAARGLRARHGRLVGVQQPLQGDRASIGPLRPAFDQSQPGSHRNVYYGAGVAAFRTPPCRAAQLPSSRIRRAAASAFFVPDGPHQETVPSDPRSATRFRPHPPKSKHKGSGQCPLARDRRTGASARRKSGPTVSRHHAGAARSLSVAESSDLRSVISALPRADHPSRYPADDRSRRHPG